MKNFLVEMILVSGLLSGYYFLFLRNKQFHFFNRFYLLAVLLLSVAVPFLHIPVQINMATEMAATPQTITGFISTGSLPENVAGTASAKTILFQNDPVQWLWLFYGSVVLILIMRLFFIFLRIARLLKSNTVQKIDNILVVNTNEQDAPFSFYKWVFWNSHIELDSLSHRQIMNHEAVHIRQKHSVDIVFAEIVFALFWINPFFYLVKKELKTVHEFLADRSIKNDCDKAVFARLLLLRALGTTTPVGHNFFGSITSRRISMMSFSPERKKAYLQRAGCIILAAGTLLVFSFDAVQKRVLDQPVKEIQGAFPVFKNKQEENKAISNKPITGIPEPHKAEGAKAPVVAPAGTVPAAEQKGDEISFLNYRDDAISYGIGMPANNIIPGFVHTRSDETQVLIGNGKNELPFFYPAPKYNELILIFNRHNKDPLGNDWRLLVIITDERGKPVKEETLAKEWITGFETVRISFKNFIKGTYHLQVKSNDHSYSTSCKVVKDFDG